MLRFIIITAFNLALPFVLRGLYISALRLLAKHQNKKSGMKNITPPRYSFPVGRLLIVGFILLVITLCAYRFLGIEETPPFEGNKVISGKVE